MTSRWVWWLRIREAHPQYSRTRYIISVLLPVLSVLFTPLAVLAAPNITLTPSNAMCTSAHFPITIEGTDFTPGEALEIYDFDVAAPSNPQPIGVRIGTATVGIAGSFSAVVQLANCTPNTPAGTHYTIVIYRDMHGAPGQRETLASTVFTVGTIPNLPNTGGGAGRVHSPWILVSCLLLIMGTGRYSRRLKQHSVSYNRPDSLSD